MNEFTASNGYTILARENATVDWWSADHVHTGIIQVFTHSQVWQALREFFQHERDEELGRWRWELNPHLLVYPDPDGDVVVVNEATGTASSLVIRRDIKHWNPASDTAKAAAAYFEAHPERNPWEEAKHNEVWVLFVAINEEAYRVDGGSFVPVNNPCRVRIPLDDTRIRTARRIWPESD